MKQKKSILIVDDHPLFREGLKSMLERDRRFAIAGEAGTGQDGLAMAKKIQPDMILIDVSLPDMSGIHLIYDIRKALPDIHIIIVSMHSKVDYIAEAFKAGATGYVSKDSASDMLLQGIEKVSKGEFFMDSSLSHKVIERLTKLPVRETRISGNDYSSLTPREQEIMRMLAEGTSPKETASKLCISPKTVENHRANIMKKLNLKGTMELVRYAARIGLIDIDLWK
ncbi:MAG: DNA-binding response regulator [Desulfobacterium sp.]|nr:DNA-binding response regulator [Desulfobacterium sp.]